MRTIFFGLVLGAVLGSGIAVAAQDFLLMMGTVTATNTARVITVTTAGAVNVEAK